MPSCRLVGVCDPTWTLRRLTTRLSFIFMCQKPSQNHGRGLLTWCCTQSLRTALSSREPVREAAGNQQSSGSDTDESVDTESDEELARAEHEHARAEGQGLVQMDAELNHGSSAVRHLPYTCLHAFESWQAGPASFILIPLVCTTATGRPPTSQSAEPHKACRLGRWSRTCAAG